VEKYYLVRRVLPVVAIPLRGDAAAGKRKRPQTAGFFPFWRFAFQPQEIKSRHRHPGVAISFDHGKIQQFVKYFS
jgi:hypothetical protein